MPTNENEKEQQPELFPEYAAPDFTDTAVWVRVETPELIRLEHGNDKGREVLSGRVVVSYRRRTPEDGTAEVVRERPKSTVVPDVEEGATWPTWGEPKLRVDPRVNHSRPIRGWSLNRNSGCMRADGSIEP
jgi:hypothetical protein